MVVRWWLLLQLVVLVAGGWLEGLHQPVLVLVGAVGQAAELTQQLQLLAPQLRPLRLQPRRAPLVVPLLVEEEEG